MITTGIKASTGKERPKSIRMDVERSRNLIDPMIRPNSTPMIEAMAHPASAVSNVRLSAAQKMELVRASPIPLKIWITPGSIDGMVPLAISSDHKPNRIAIAATRWTNSQPGAVVVSFMVYLKIVVDTKCRR